MTDAHGTQDMGPLERVVRHCDMVAWGHRRGPQFTLLDEVGQQFILFAGLHLLTTMFLVTDGREDDCPGFVRKILRDHDAEHLLSGVDEVLRRPLGDTTLGDSIRRFRNRMATHGVLAGTSLPEAELELRRAPDTDAADDLMEELTREVESLGQSVRQLSGD